MDSLSPSVSLKEEVNLSNSHFSPEQFEKIRKVVRDLIKRGELEERHLEEEIFASHGSPENITIGIELEMMKLNRESKKPSKGGDGVTERLKESGNYTIELGRSYLERVFGPKQVGDDLGDIIEDGIEATYREVSEAQEALGVDDEIIALGTPPNLDPEDLQEDWLTPGERFNKLNEYALKSRNGDISVNMTTRAGESVKFSFPGIASWFASLQVNIQPENREDLLKFANIHNAYIALFLAPTVAAPIFCKEALDKESRIGIFTQAWELGRVGFYGYIDSIQEYHAKTLLYNAALTEIQKPENKLDLANLNQHSGSIHFWNRIKSKVEDGKIVEWLELRPSPAVPASHDNAVNSIYQIALGFGLLVEMKAGVFSEQDLKQQIESGRHEIDFMAVVAGGLEAKLRAPGFDSNILLEKQTKRIMELCGKGLLYLGMTGEKTKRYMASLESRLFSGVTEADWMLNRKKELEKLDCNLWEQFMSDLLQCAKENIPVHERETEDLILRRKIT